MIAPSSTRLVPGAQLRIGDVIVGVRTALGVATLSKRHIVEAVYTDPRTDQRSVRLAGDHWIDVTGNTYEVTA